MEPPRQYGITTQTTSLYAHRCDSLRIWSAGCKPHFVMLTLIKFHCVFPSNCDIIQLQIWYMCSWWINHRVQSALRKSVSGASTQPRKAPLNIRYVRLSVRLYPHVSARLPPDGFRDIYVWGLVWKSAAKNSKFGLKSGKNIGHFKWIPEYVALLPAT